jgi:hypothetical protein
MARTDVHLDAMLRHLGAAYYDSLHGRAAAAVYPPGPFGPQAREVCLYRPGRRPSMLAP